MKRIVLLLAMFAGCPGLAQATCNAHFHGQAGTRSDGLVTGVRAGEPCTIPVYLSGTGHTSMAGIEIVRPPKHGSLVVQGSALIYTPRSSFAGKDSFFVRFPMQNQAGERRKGAGIRFAVKA
ncbi:MAG: hypothetical protein MUF11_15025 [Beijerinckiaceae bacterium]|jgi:hypothetical protein|nr:hypothetical protein [Beijerinckiaceae bacterium]